MKGGEEELVSVGIGREAMVMSTEKGVPANATGTDFRKGGKLMSGRKLDTSMKIASKERVLHKKKGQKGKYAMACGSIPSNMVHVLTGLQKKGKFWATCWFEGFDSPIEQTALDVEKKQKKGQIFTDLRENGSENINSLIFNAPQQ